MLTDNRYCELLRLLFVQDASKLKEIQKAVGLLSINAQTPKSMEDARRKHYQFWDTQPVPKLGRYKVVAVDSCMAILCLNRI